MTDITLVAPLEWKHPRYSHIIRKDRIPDRINRTKPAENCRVSEERLNHCARYSEIVGVPSPFVKEGNAPLHEHI